MKNFRIVPVLVCAGWLFGLPCHAITGNEQIELAGSGRYEELAQKLELDAAKQTLKTPDLHALCFAYSKTKRYNKLMPCLDQLAARIANGDKRTRLFGLDDATATINLMRGEALVELAQYPAAIAEAKKALDWYQRTDSDDKDIQINALVIEALASTFAGNRGEAEKYADTLDQVSVAWPASNEFKSIKALAVGKVSMALGRYERAYEAISGDRSFAVHAFLDRLVSGAFLTGKNNWAWQELPRSFMLNKALFGMGKLAEAKAGYDQLLTIPQVKDNGEIYWLILYDRGQIAEHEHQLEEAARFYRRAIEVIESQRTSINTEANKIGFVGDKQDVYGHLVSALYGSKQYGEAFEYIERAKSRALVDLLASKQSIPVSAKEKRSAAVSLADLTIAELELRAQVPISATEGKSQQREFKSKVADQLRQSAPELSSLVSVTTLPIKDLQALIPEDEVVVQYYYQNEIFIGDVATRSGVKSIRLDLKGMEAEVRQFRESIAKRDKNTITIAQSLYRRLILPLEPSFGKKNVLIIPHGILHYLPFAALHSGDQYFVEKYPFRILPNASILKYLRPSTNDRNGSILVLGNPDLGDPRYDLPNAQTEAESIARMMPNSRLLVRQQASKTTFKKISGNYRYIHFASHGEFDVAAPLNSALLLAKDGKDDGQLTVNELYSTELNADLVTLSACETGLGKITSGDDIIGLTRAFFYAGSSSVIASLWEVDDVATSYLMIQLYTALSKQNKRDALRTAQLATMKKFSHPYFWAAFYLTGNVI